MTDAPSIATHHFVVPFWVTLVIHGARDYAIDLADQLGNDGEWHGGSPEDLSFTASSRHYRFTSIRRDTISEQPLGRNQPWEVQFEGAFAIDAPGAAVAAQAIEGGANPEGWWGDEAFVQKLVTGKPLLTIALNVVEIGDQVEVPGTGLITVADISYPSVNGSYELTWLDGSDVRQSEEFAADTPVLISIPGPTFARISYEHQGFMTLAKFRRLTASAPGETMITMYDGSWYNHIDEVKLLDEDEGTVILFPGRAFDAQSDM